MVRKYLFALEIYCPTSGHQVWIDTKICKFIKSIGRRSQNLFKYIRKWLLCQYISADCLLRRFGILKMYSLLSCPNWNDDVGSIMHSLPCLHLSTCSNNLPTFTSKKIGRKSSEVMLFGFFSIRTILENF